jgi:serine O-acetyltransferase
MADLLKTLADDYRRHHSSLRNMAFWAIATYRFGRWADELPPGWRFVGGKVYGAMSLVVEATSGILLSREAQIGESFHLIHAGNIKIHPKSVIGDRVGIMHDVTLGTTPDGQGFPTLGNDVFVGAGAKILGGVKIGDRARIAANSLVLSDVPPDTTAIGVPARIVRYTGRPAPEYRDEPLAKDSPLPHRSD